jgi:uncharacterized protein
MLSKTQSGSHEKTVLGRSKYLLVGGFLILFLVILINPISRQYIECATFGMPTNGTVHVGDKSIITERVYTESGRQNGLSGRQCIKENQAMLFVFDKADQTNHCFWMKDMRFGIDMIWLDSDKKVVNIVRDVQPQTYPQSFCPERPTEYVMEIKQNTAKSLGLEIGTVVKF